MQNWHLWIGIFGYFTYLFIWHPGGTEYYFAFIGILTWCLILRILSHDDDSYEIVRWSVAIILLRKLFLKFSHDRTNKKRVVKHNLGKIYSFIILANFLTKVTYLQA